MKKSLQQIEDYYIRKGFTGDKLRKDLENDKEYQKILAERKTRLTQKFKITPREKKRYVLSTNQDYEILAKIHWLEKQKLSPEDKRFIKFIHSQLELDWRSSIMRWLNNILKKYKKS